MRNLCIPIDKFTGVVHTLQILQRFHCEGVFLRLKQSPLTYLDIDEEAQEIKDLCRLVTSEKRGSNSEQYFDAEH